MSLQPKDNRSEESVRKEEVYLQTLREASDYLVNGTPLYRKEETSTNKRRSGRFLKKSKQPLKKRILKFLTITLIAILCMSILATATFLILFRIGQNRMLSHEEFTPQFPQQGETMATAPTESQTTDATEETTEADRILVYDDGKTVSYKGELYTFNEHITTVLLIGVDKEELEDDAIRGSGGEADCILLLSMDTQTGETKIVNISRETYAQVDIYSSTDKLIESKGTQLCRAYAYGDGGELSCENTMKSVKRILYGMPIHAYAALDMRFIGAATDAVGGITLTTLSDVKMPDLRIVPEGTLMDLRGREAEFYVRYRDKTMLNSNLIRMDRQKQFIQLFAKKTLMETKRDLTTLLDLYKALSQYMTTDLTLADITFLLGTFLNHGATFEFTALKGQLDKLDINAIYYLDETHTYETVLDLYYTKVDP